MIAFLGKHRRHHGESDDETPVGMNHNRDEPRGTLPSCSAAAPTLAAGEGCIRGQWIRNLLTSCGIGARN